MQAFTSELIPHSSFVVPRASGSRGGKRQKRDSEVSSRGGVSDLDTKILMSMIGNTFKPLMSTSVTLPMVRGKKSQPDRTVRTCGLFLAVILEERRQRVCKQTDGAENYE
jgi:hypothetical protein